MERGQDFGLAYLDKDVVLNRLQKMLVDGESGSAICELCAPRYRLT